MRRHAKDEERRRNIYGTAKTRTFWTGTRWDVNRGQSSEHAGCVIIEAEQAGVEQIWVGGPPWKLETLTALAAAVMRTTSIKLGTSVLQVFSRHPVLMAQQALSFDALAPGRLRLGMGTSSLELSKSMYGVKMEHRPLAYLREYFQVLRPLLQTGEVHHQGHYFTTDASLYASARIPLLISALGPKAFHLAGEIADGAMPAHSPIPYLLDTALPAMREGATAARWECPPIVAHVTIIFAEDRATALEVGRQRLGTASAFPVYRNMYIRAGFSPQELETASDRFIESLIIFGDDMLSADLPDHTRLRRLVAKAFTPRAIELLQPRIQQIADELLDAVQDQGQMDLIADFAFPLPITVISEMLGIPVKDQELFRTLSQAIIHYPDVEDRPAILEAFVLYMSTLLVEKRTHPTDDLISNLIQAEERGDTLSEDELISTTILLIVAGHETTANLIGNGTLALLQHPE